MAVISMSDAVSSETRKNHCRAFQIREKELKLRARKSLKPQQKMAEQNKFVQGKSIDEGDWHSSDVGECSFRRKDADARATHLKSSKTSKSARMKGDSVENDELVKHMTCLPSYLQQAERKETLQEKALNVGVLDWSKLENFTQKSKALNVTSLPDTNDVSTITGDCHEKISMANKLLSRSYQGTAPTKSRHHGAASEMGMSISGFRHLRNRNDSMTASANVMHHTKIDTFKEGIVSLPTIRRKQDLVSEMEKGMVEDDGITKRSINRPASNEYVVEEYCCTKQSSKGLFLRTRWNGSSSEAPQQRDCMNMSNENSIETCRNCFSCADSEEFYSVDPMGECRTIDKIPKCWDDASQVRKSGNELPEGRIYEKNVSDGVHSIPEDSSNGERFQSVYREFGEVSARRGPPNGKFSLSGIRRSFSYKERASATTIISGRSESMTTEDLMPTKDKQNIYAKLRFGSLRRLFDQILKYKPVASNICIEETQSHLNSSIHRSTHCEESLPLKKQDLTSQALLQLTVVKGGPLLKFMVDNDCKILVCSTKDLTSPRNCERRFTFYSLDDSRKRIGSWVSQGCKTNNGEFVCSQVGHMCTTQSENSGENTLDRVHVLFSSETGNSGKDYKYCNSTARAEVAAIVSKVPMHACRKVRHRNEYADLVEGILPGKRCYRNVPSEDNGTTTVILPGAIHSLPNDGGPSSLVRRWRSGGSCDCGGWDVGCKLSILSNKKISSKIPTSPDICSTFACFELIPQGESDSNRPIFSMKPEKKGIYSVKFDSLISSLQACAICTAFISSQISSEPLDSGRVTKSANSGELYSDQNSATISSQIRTPGKIFST